jgi:hypothetical protein
MQKMPIVYQKAMVSGLLRIALLIGLVTGALYYFSPATFSRVAHVDCKAWAMNVLSKLHLDLFQKAINEHPIQVIVSLLRNENSHEGVQRLSGLHRAIQKLTKTPLCQEAEIDRSIGDLDALDKEVMASLRGLTGCRLQGEAQNKARVLEQILLTRIHELIVWRKSCESSHQHALKDPLPENALLPVPELVATTPPSTASSAGTSQIPDTREAMPSLLGGPVPSTHKNPVNEVDPDFQKRAKELEKTRVQLKAADTNRRRELFAQGAKQRWKENSSRLKVQIQEDLKRLDVLMASAVL